MKSCRLAAAGVLAIPAAVALIAAMALSGCGRSGASASGGGARSSAPATPRGTLLASVSQFDRTSYDVVVTGSSASGHGSVDPADKRASMSLGGTANGVRIKMDAVTVGRDVWIRMDLGAAINRQLRVQPSTWMHLDLGKLGPGATLPLDANGGDALDMGGILAGVATVRRVDVQHFAGTIDLTRTSGVAAPGADAVKRAGTRARSVPFTATVDDQGRLTDLTVNADSIDPALDLETSFRDYGRAAGVSQPSGAAVEAPETVYGMFKRG